ncbi:MAG TPA: exopolysaccharide biosynthesis polyprenyl glycosylphosphotransferase [Candidatus Paceibacterota bacterium]|jgi:exopolysaccharide biosynthesis polyprenyl glycosylphosphotransferase|nr:exopolysaccharide biosynthesis polyprenyl glycosylphosphotransferase [Candidatus Paceibacterota bacterium]
MTSVLRPRTLILFLGDLVFFALALWVSLYLRTFDAPDGATYLAHLYPFSILFVAWVLVYFVAGLYESRSIVLARRALSATLLVAQTINMVIAALFFFLVPLFGIAPKTLLVIYLIVSFLLVLFWRAFLFPFLGLSRTEAAVLVGEGHEIQELARAMNAAHRAPVRVEEVISPSTSDLKEAIIASMERNRARVVIANFDDERVSAAFPQMYNLLSVGVRFIDALTVYEDIFGRIPLSRLSTAWLARNVSRYANTFFYDVLKRLMDISAAVVGLAVTLPFYPFIIAAQKIQDGGVIFYRQVRVGLNSAPMHMLKFRSMTGTDQGAEMLKTRHTVTPVGRVIRKTRIDEAPQLWNILLGDMSLIGPRPEFPAMVEEYAKNIPYYNLRHLVKPGLSGWAQLYHHQDPHHGTDIEETRNKLSYDLYYLKHRSLLLDITIAMKTIRRVLVA